MQKKSHNATLLVNKLHAPVTVLGPGRRLGIWLQGCRIHCKSCVSQDTWAFDPQTAMPISAIVEWCAKAIRQAADPIIGITISGGEPFDQPEGLMHLLRGLRQLKRNPAGDEIDLLCYSGYPLKTLQKHHAVLLARLDAVIPEPFADALPYEKRWRGSANQTLEPLSPLGLARYAPHLDDAAPKEMQTMLEGGRIWFIGIPHRGDMPRLEALCRERGIDFSQVSWRR